jgi:hypothetical protein
LQIPKGSTHPRFAHLPELESFATTDKEERIRSLRDAITGAYKDPEFFKDYKKITGETPSPLMPDEFDEILKKLPRDPQDADLFKKVAGTGPLPPH